MTPKLTNVLFCDSVVPLPEHKLALYGVFTDVFAPSFPFTCPHFNVVNQWSKGEGFHIQVVKLLNPSKSLIISQSPEQYFTLEEVTETAYVKTEVNQVVFTEPGTYYFQVFLDQKFISEFGLHLRER